MSKLIPGRVRNQGITLYEKELVTIELQTEELIEACVDGHHLQYALEDDRVRCDCDFFASKKYCQHLAALEHFLKNDSQGKEMSNSLSSRNEEDKKVKKNTSFGSVFLDGLTVNEDDRTKYRLAVEGAQSPYSSDYWWTLKINRLPDERSYVIRDIKAFLTVINREGYYQIGKNYFEPLSLIQFDQPSQDFLHFLFRIIPESTRIDLDFILPNNGRHLVLSRGFFEEGCRLMVELYHFSLDIDHQVYHHLIFRELEGSENLFSFDVCVHRQSIELIITEKQVQSLFDNHYLFYRGTCYHLNYKQRKLLSSLKTLPIALDLAKHVHFDVEDQTKLAANLIDFETLGTVTAPKTFQIRDFQPIFNLSLNGNREVVLDLQLDYGDFTISSRRELDELPFASHYKHEERLFTSLAELGFSSGFKAYYEPLGEKNIYEFFERVLPTLRKMGVTHLSEDLEDMYHLDRPQVVVQRQGNLLDISFDFSTIYESDVDDALEALFKNQPYFISDSGKLVVFDNETQKISRALKDLRAKQVTDAHLQLGAITAFQVAELFQDLTSVQFSKDFEKLAYDLRHPEEFEIVKPKVKAEFRDYQLAGVHWMTMLDHYGFGGILADDMGLGKTLQTIAFLKSKMTEETRVLVLSPSSLIYNWQDEFEKFAPDLDVVVSYGSKPTRDAVISENHQVIITSYASFRQDFDQYNQLHFDYLILDEAQVIKNTQTKIAQHLNKFEAKNCFALSGTPIENKLLEIWSIFQIVLPGLLPTKKAFMKMEAKQVAHFIKPFVMRRRKEDVLPELPDLIEINQSNELADEQKVIYLAQLRQMQDRIRGASDSDINRHKIEILSGITRLRQICDTPSLFMDYDGSSGKLDSLYELLKQIKENGHRALIFSQFRGMLDIAEERMGELGLTSYKITGSTPANVRQEMTRAFNNGSKDVFLISLKAGGVGLNLTGADTVILVDLWWNPAVEMQAISRAHRLGQKENVEVYRLITRGTIEEKILDMQESKKNLVTTVLDGNESRASMSIDDIKEILGLRS